jgi:hypothetical protein
MSRSPQTVQTPPAIGRMSERQSAHTGSREIFTRGEPQIRQSEGKKAAKRLSAAALTQEANKGSALTAIGEALSRVRSPLLLKTPSLRQTRRGRRPADEQRQYIGPGIPAQTPKDSLGQRRPGRIRFVAFLHRDVDRLIAAAKASPATHRAEQQKPGKIFFSDGSWT